MIYKQLFTCFSSSLWRILWGAVSWSTRSHPSFNSYILFGRQSEVREKATADYDSWGWYNNARKWISLFMQVNSVSVSNNKIYNIISHQSKINHYYHCCCKLSNHHTSMHHWHYSYTIHRNLPSVKLDRVFPILGIVMIIIQIDCALT